MDTNFNLIFLHGGVTDQIEFIILKNIPPQSKFFLVFSNKNKISISMIT